jgi:anti-sigma regulatory factor (Ser/Thr protein kinase)
VLITAPGDEDEAVRALERGAASYVTRQHLVRDLVRVLQGVRAVKRRRRASDELFKYVTDQQYEFAIPSRRRLVSAAATYLQDVVTRGSRIDDISRVHVRVALEEALFNALIHGNFEITSDLREDDDEEYERLIQERERTAPYSERPIVVRARVTAEQAEFTIRDEGRGFNPKAIPDPTASGSVDRASGRGLLLIRSFMDEVQYNMAGNEITMRRSLAACTRRKPERAMAMS